MTEDIAKKVDQQDVKLRLPILTPMEYAPSGFNAIGTAG